RALTVAAIDPRPVTASVHLSVFRGLDGTFDGRLPLLGAVVPPPARELAIGVPPGNGEQAADYRDARGLGLRAGRAARGRGRGGRRGRGRRGCAPAGGPRSDGVAAS